jgi:hypothetical protein
MNDSAAFFFSCNVTSFNIEPVEAQSVNKNNNRESKSMQSSKNNIHNFSEEEKEKILSVVLKNIVMIDGKLYGLEDDSESEVFVDCLSKLSSCRAVCCSYEFALTQEEVKKGIYRYNPSRPYYMAKDADGFCSYLDRATFFCSIHKIRPRRCRKYTCERSSSQPSQSND